MKMPIYKESLNNTFGLNLLTPGLVKLILLTIDHDLIEYHLINFHVSNFADIYGFII